MGVYWPFSIIKVEFRCYFRQIKSCIIKRLDGSYVGPISVMREGRNLIFPVYGGRNYFFSEIGMITV